jgi:DNA-binding NarL/FixJ family response regulator
MPLTQKEMDVVVLVGKGYTNPQIGLELGIPTGTVRTRLYTIYRKMKLHKNGNRRVRLTTWWCNELRK